MIVFDNIVFELQRIGGVSKHWSKLINVIDKTPRDVAFLEGRGAASNVFRRDMTITKPIVADPGWIMRRRLSRVSARCDVFHSSYYRTSRNARANVVTIHDFMNEMFPTSARDIVLSKLKRRACRAADRIVVVSKRTRNDLIRHYPFIDPSIIRVVYNGVGPEFFPDPSDSVRAGDLTISRRRYFLYVGSRAYCKNFPFVLSFVAEARRKGIELPLVLVGPPLTRAERAGASSLGLPLESLIQLSDASDVVLRQLYSNCAAMLIPSRYEGFGLPAAEAARCGALVLAARGSSLDEVVGNTEFSFDLALTNEASRVLDLDIEGPDAELERKRVQRRSSRFSWSHSALELMSVYDDLA